MVRVASLFSQLLSHIPRTSFQSLVVEHQAERGAKGFRCWTQLVAMLLCYLARVDSLREIFCGLRCCLGKLKHLGVNVAPNKSTLSYANSHRPAALFEDLYYQLYGHLQDQGGFGHRKRRFRFKNKLLSLDATTITLCLSLFPWASYRRTKGGVKVNVLFQSPPGGSTTTTTCPRSCASPRPRNTRSRPLGRYRWPPNRSSRWTAPTTTTSFSARGATTTSSSSPG